MKVQDINASELQDLQGEGQELLGLSPEQFQALADSIFLVVPHRQSEGVAGPLMTCSLAWGFWRLRAACVQDNFAGNMDITRHGMVDLFLKYAAGDPRLRHLVMIDNDEDIPWLAPFKLALWNRDVVSGVICSVDENRGGVYANFTVKDDLGVPRYPSTMFTKVLPGAGLVEAHDVGTGLVCISRSVLETMKSRGMDPFRIPEDVRDRCFSTGRLIQSEDIAFSRQCQSLGVKLYVDLSVRGRHLKKLWIAWPEAMVDNDMPPSRWKVDAREYHHG